MAQRGQRGMTTVRASRISARTPQLDSADPRGQMYENGAILAAFLPIVHLSSQTSSIRQPLKMLLTIKVTFLTFGCQHVAPRL